LTLAEEDGPQILYNSAD